MASKSARDIFWPFLDFLPGAFAAAPRSGKSSSDFFFRGSPRPGKARSAAKDDLVSLASSSAWRRETRGALGGVGRISVSRGAGRRRSSARGTATGRGRGDVEAGECGATARARVRSERAASRRGGAVGFSRNDRARPSEPRRASPSRWRARAARAPRDGARVPRARRERRVAEKSLEEPSRRVPGARVGVRARRRRDQPRGRRAGRRRRRPRRRAARFDFLAAPGRGRGDGRGAHLVGPGSRGAPCGHAGIGVSVRSMRREASVGGRADVLKRDTLATAFSTRRTRYVSSPPLSAEDLPVRDLETFTPANESRIRRLVSRAKNISFSSGYSPSEKCSRSVCCLAFDGAASARGGPSANRDAAADPSSALSLPPFTPIPSVHSPFGVRESPECVGDFGFGGF